MELARPGNVLIGGMTCALGGYIVGISEPAYISLSATIISVMSFMAAGNVVNDIVDRNIDSGAHPYRPIPSGRISIEKAKILAAGCWAISVLCMVVSTVLIREENPTWWGVPLIWSLAAVLMATYDLGPQIKGRGISGNISISLLVGAVIIFGAASVGGIGEILVWLVAATAFFVNLGREIVKDCEDMQSDEGRNTFPMKVGVENARMTAYVLALAGLICAALPYYLSILPLQWLLLQTPALLLVITTNKALVSGEDEKAQKALRKGLLMGLLGFAASVALT